MKASKRDTRGVLRGGFKGTTVPSSKPRSRAGDRANARGRDFDMINYCQTTDVSDFDNLPTTDDFDNLPTTDVAKQPTSAPHMLRIVPHTVARVGRSHEHFPDGFELHLLPGDVHPQRTTGLRFGWGRGSGVG